MKTPVEFMKPIRRYLKIINMVARTEPSRLLALIKHFEYGLAGKASFEKKIPTDPNNEAWPWYTYPAIEFLSQFDFSACSMFEYGSGNSSFFWAKRARKILSVESDAAWYSKIESAKLENQEIMLKTSLKDYVESIHLKDEKYDVVIVDADYRFNCAKEAVQRVNPGGIIILDNSDWYPGVISYLVENRFSQIDFIGWGPVNSYAWSTSLFFMEKIQIPRRTRAIEVIGGISKELQKDDEFLRTGMK